MVIAQFENLKFGVSSSTALLLNHIKMSAECETEDQTDSSQQYVTAKNGKPLQMTFTAILDSNLGCDVKSNASYLMNGAQRSLQGYFYIAGTKVFPFRLMIVKAETEEIMLSPAGKWVKANVNITLKQSTKDWITGSAPTPSQPEPQSTGGGSGGGATTPAKASVNTTGWLSTAAAGLNAAAIVAAAAPAIKKLGTPTSTGAKTTSTAAKVSGVAKVKGAVSAAASVTSTAKKVTSTVAKTSSSAVKKVISFAAKIASARKK